MNPSPPDSIASGWRGRRRARSATVAAASLGLLLAGRPAGAQTVFAAEGTVDLNYSLASPQTPGTGAVVTEIRPGVVFQNQTSRIAWNASYRFTGSLSLDGQWTNSYSNHLILGASTALSDRTTLDLGASASQGGVAFQLTDAPADAGSPTFRPPGNPNFVTVTLREGIGWQASPEFSLAEGLTAMMVAPQYSLDQFNGSLVGFLRANRTFSTNQVLAEWAPTVALLRAPGGGSFLSLTNSLQAGWNHDFTTGWNGQLNGGIAHVISFVGENPSAVVPVGSATARYFSRDLSGALSVTYGPYTNLTTGSVSQSGSITARGSWRFDPLLARHLAGSVGFRRSRPLGVVTPTSLAGLGDALQGDLGFVWALTPSVRFNARVSVAYQFNQPAGIPDSLVQVFLVGVTALYSSAAYVPPMPTQGQRVDGADAIELGAPLR